MERIPSKTVGSSTLKTWACPNKTPEVKVTTIQAEVRLPWKCWWKKSTFQTVRLCLPTPFAGLTWPAKDLGANGVASQIVANCMFYMVVRGELVVGGTQEARWFKSWTWKTLQRSNSTQREQIPATFCEKGSCWAPFTRQRTTIYEVLPELRWKQDRWVIPGAFSDGDTKRYACSAENHVSPCVGIWRKDYMCTDQEGSPWLTWVLGCWPSFITPFKKNKLSSISHLENMYEANGDSQGLQPDEKCLFANWPWQYKLNFRGCSNWWLFLHSRYLAASLEGDRK